MSKPKPLPLLLLITVLLTIPTHSLPFPFPIPFSTSLTQLRTIHSILHSLSTRVATLRTARGDFSGANRANLLTRTLDALTSPRVILSLSWDFLRHYAWRDTASFWRLASDITPDVRELLSSLSELTMLNSDSDRAAWVGRNYQKVLRASSSVFRRLLSVLNKSGAMRDMVEALRREMVDGEFLKDCLEVGGNDLKGLFQILKEMTFQNANVGHQEL